MHAHPTQQSASLNSVKVRGSDGAFTLSTTCRAVASREGGSTLIEVATHHYWWTSCFFETRSPPGLARSCPRSLCLLCRLSRALHSSAFLLSIAARWVEAAGV